MIMINVRDNIGVLHKCIISYVNISLLILMKITYFFKRHIIQKQLMTGPKYSVRIYFFVAFKFHHKFTICTR